MIRNRWNVSRASSSWLGIVLLLAAAAVVWQCWGMGQGLLLSSDNRRAMWPWRGVLPSEHLQAPVLSDPDQQFVPWLDLAHRELSSGRLPLWNPYQDGGVPLLGNGQSALGSPLIWPVLLLGVGAGWNLSLLLRIVVAAVGTFLWLAELGRSRAAALLGAAMFALSGPFVAWLEHPHTLTVAGLPLLLYLIRRQQVRPGWRSGVGIVATTYVILSGGHPETALMAAMFVAVSRPWQGARRVIPFAGIGALVAAPLLLPLASYILHSAAWAGARRPPFVLPDRALLRFVLPNVSFGHPIEAAATVSLTGLVLAALALVLQSRRSAALGWLAVGAFILLLCYGNPVSRWLASTTPVYWTRALLILPLPLAVLASTGLDGLAELIREQGWKALASIVLVIAPTLAFGELVWAGRGVHAVTSSWLRETSTPLLDFLHRDRSVFRVLPLGTFLPPNLATEERLEDVRGYDALAPRGWRASRESIGHFVRDMMTVGRLRLGGRGLDFWNIKYILSAPVPDHSLWRQTAALGLRVREVYRGPDGVVLENLDCLPRARLPAGGTVRISHRTATEWILVVDAERTGELVVANPYFPGWKLTVDGKPTSIAVLPGDAIKVPVAEGEHQVVLRYWPLSLSLGVGLALVGLMALLVAVVFVRPRSAATETVIR